MGMVKVKRSTRAVGESGLRWTTEKEESGGKTKPDRREGGERWEEEVFCWEGRRERIKR